jgi:hypothetical protein
MKNYLKKKKPTLEVNKKFESMIKLSVQPFQQEEGKREQVIATLRVF